MWRQYELTEVRNPDNHKITWLDTKKPLKIGNIITLHGGVAKWNVIWVGSIEREDPPKKKWQVGGL